MWNSWRFWNCIFAECSGIIRHKAAEFRSQINLEFAVSNRNTHICVLGIKVLNCGPEVGGHCCFVCTKKNLKWFVQDIFQILGAAVVAPLWVLLTAKSAGSVVRHENVARNILLVLWKDSAAFLSWSLFPDWSWKGEHNLQRVVKANSLFNPLSSLQKIVQGALCNVITAGAKVKEGVFQVFVMNTHDKTEIRSHFIW